MIKQRSMNFIGSRVIKTGVAVFLTSLICQWLEWPAVFAVITAIVTIEPTVNDSIKKGIIRLPASAIGSAYAVFFISLFGNSAITYTAAAMFTIITCFKLKLHAGLLVATLTSVAMIEVIHDQYLIAFFIRLGTTSIGIIISTLVNMFVLPPNYSKRILTNIDTALQTTGEELKVIAKDLLFETTDCTDKKQSQETFSKLKMKLDTTDRLLLFQQAEAKYHRLTSFRKTELQDELEKLKALRLIHYHIGNLINTPLQPVSWSKVQRDQMVKTIQSVADTMIHPDHFRKVYHQKQIKALMTQFLNYNKEKNTLDNREQPTFFDPEIIILYELLSIYHLVEEILVTENTEI
ncbi:aromatic acid exporter family protein [Paraliobacillus sediminis]|uniref:aromatic acid exporter family protein n=1 Tax=Paraliobacillus sediminis TaxID=1885916 RepID=UPI001F080F9E|nr:aromatic acid exporter family protein [Paraliobacillus sediminis]